MSHFHAVWVSDGSDARRARTPAVRVALAKRGFPIVESRRSTDPTARPVKVTLTGGHLLPSPDVKSDLYHIDAKGVADMEQESWRHVENY